jgi:hypothetical protein
MEFENLGVNATLPSAAAWHHLVGVYGGGELNSAADSIYIDGVPSVVTTSGGTPSIATDEFKIGGVPTVWSCCNFTGSVDEVRVSSGTRSADWVATEYNSQSSPATFYAVLAENALAINPPSDSLYGAQSVQFAATAVDTCSSSLTWTISPAGAGTIDPTGLYTAPATITAQQQITITATNQANSSELGSATVTLLPPISVTVSPSSATLVDGSQPLQLTATVANTGNTAVT